MIRGISGLTARDMPGKTEDASFAAPIRKTMTVEKEELETHAYRFIHTENRRIFLT
jgi:hypothetical protein